jgi:UDP:flavonoid glycosyltransferase YjiC (YdhE family)
MTAALGPVIEGWKPDIVVREEGEYGGPVAAAIAGIPWVTHGWGCPLPGPETWVELGRLVAPQWEAANLALPNGPALYGQAVLDPSPPSLYAPAYPPLPHRHGIRPSPPDAGPDPGRAGRQRTGRRLAYVGFGTVALFRDPHDLLTAVVTELLALDFDVSVTTGSSQLAELLRALSPERVEVGPWVDLAALVPRCAVVVCHGGAGTVLAALAAGVPLVLLPRGAPSQLRMSAACDRRGVGRAVAWKGGNDDQIGHALREVTTSEQIRDAASAVAAEIAAMPDPSTAIAILHAVSTR